MSKPKVVGIGLRRDLILIHYVEEGDDKVDERIAAVRWKKNPALQRLVQAFAEATSQYILGGNTSLEKLEAEDLNKLFDDLLNEDDTNQ